VSAERDLQRLGEYRGPLRHLRAYLLEPGYRAVRQYRVALWFEPRGLLGRAIARLIEQRLLRQFGCHLSTRASIGPGLVMPHPTAIVIGDGCRVGENARIYQSVTLGRGGRDGGYPVLEDDVTVYPGAVIAGGIRIGRGAVIGANTVVVRNVAPGEIVRTG
jgi:serine O-acetyltransferase